MYSMIEECIPSKNTTYISCKIVQTEMLINIATVYI